MFELSLWRDNHVRRYSIDHADVFGWEVRFEEDAKLRRRCLYQDWHRVERARELLEREVSDLVEHGWVVTSRER